MDKLETTSHAYRKARTHSLVQLAGLLQKAGLVETFGISLGVDLQRNPEQKLPVAGLYKALTELNILANSDEVSIPIWQIQGLQLLGEEKRKN